MCSLTSINLQQWWGEVIYQNDDKTVLTLVNLPHNGIVNAGETIKIEMYGKKTINCLHLQVL